MNRQICMDDLLKPEPEPVAIPQAQSGEKVYAIPADVWETRCTLCVHKNWKENWAVPAALVHKQKYAELIPCRILGVCRPNDRPGECMSFSPRIDVYGICETCVHNNIFADDFCMKQGHAEERRVYWGKDFGGDARNVDYYGRHRLSVCDDYEPDFYAREGRS